MEKIEINFCDNRGHELEAVVSWEFNPDSYVDDSGVVYEPEHYDLYLDDVYLLNLRTDTRRKIKNYLTDDDLYKSQYFYKIIDKIEDVRRGYYE